ncbi:MAG: hypothetical protein IJ744_08165 [Lachnospiraceae bacterium]|nr:hypothetical protein [Lachnospiraceae bacterium]
MKVLKKMAALMMVLCLVISTAACVPTATTEEEETTAMIANPIKDFDTLAEAVADSGTSLIVSDALGMMEPAYSTIGQVVQVIYMDGDNEICIRKAPGNQDVSGDYNEYAVNKMIEVGETFVTVKGNTEGSWNVILWLSEEATYSVTSTLGVDDAMVNALVTGVQ